MSTVSSISSLQNIATIYFCYSGVPVERKTLEKEGLVKNREVVVSEIVAKIGERIIQQFNVYYDEDEVWDTRKYKPIDLFYEEGVAVREGDEISLEVLSYREVSSIKDGVESEKVCGTKQTIPLGSIKFGPSSGGFYQIEIKRDPNLHTVNSRVLDKVSKMSDLQRPEGLNPDKAMIGDYLFSKLSRAFDDLLSRLIEVVDLEAKREFIISISQEEDFTWGIYRPIKVFYLRTLVSQLEEAEVQSILTKVGRGVGFSIDFGQVTKLFPKDFFTIVFSKVLLDLIKYFNLEVTPEVANEISKSVVENLPNNDS